MLNKISSAKMGRGNNGWLQTYFHFSFADYFDKHNMRFGCIRALNDDIVAPSSGFPMHMHKNMEIISYVINGEITHKDVMGNENTLTRGHMQYMSAGSGISHSEYNNATIPLRLLQIWVLPDEKDHMPNYYDEKFRWEDRKNQWLHMVSSKLGAAKIRVHQDVNIYSLELDENKEISFEVNSERQAYLVQIEGSGKVSDILLEERDALKIIEELVIIKATTKSHYLLVEMKKQ